MGAGGQWAAGEGVVDGAHGFRVVKIISRFRCSFFNRDVVVSGKNSDALHTPLYDTYLKLWYGTLSTHASSTRGYMKIIWREEDNLCVTLYLPTGPLIVHSSLSTNSGHNGRNFCNFGVSAFVQVTKQTE
jgi:hypothetical protein